ncbi:MAG: DNA mismatch repair endonuclease MutL, partial [Candidatus Hodarchaeales archaeon]
MVQVKKLDPVCISKIAAGEVIERPSSVVKELIENSIDASATEIVVEIKNGGKDLIKISDNGCGISSEDLALAIKRHTTSKITSEKDLQSISTMGFRGEALYSIASVSRFSITSRTVDEEIATKIYVEGDIETVKLSEKVMPSPGTIIEVRDLFFNFNVRRKFLKKASLEEAYIYEIVAQYAIAHPEISFKLISDETLEFQTVKSQDYFQPIKKTLGIDIAKSLIDIGDVQRNNITIQGYISKPGHHRRTRKFQYFYLNKRRIYSKVIQTALEEGFQDYIMKKQFPIAFLFLEMDPDQYDVNIHPQKREVLFYDDQAVKLAVASAVLHCLKTRDIMPQYSDRSKMTQTTFPTPKIGKDLITKKVSTTGSIQLQSDTEQSEIVNYFDRKVDLNKWKATIKSELSLLGTSVKYKGQLGNEFLMLEDEQTHDLIILDFHASHERINLEKLTNMYKSGKPKVQTFLKPFEITLYPEQKARIKELIQDLLKLGFDVRLPRSNPNAIEIYSVPKILVGIDLKEFFYELVNDLPEQTVENRIKEIISISACHGAYRAG